MAKIGFCLAIVFLFIALAFMVEATAGSTNGGLYMPDGPEGSVHVEECPDKCDYRCSAASLKKLCLATCKYCSKRCLCVPSGTSGNKEECPCYSSINVCP